MNDAVLNVVELEDVAKTGINSPKFSNRRNENVLLHDDAQRASTACIECHFVHLTEMSII